MAVSATSSSTTTTSSVSSVTGLDYDALVASVVAAKEAPADSIDVQIDENTAKIGAYQELQSLLDTLTDAANALRVPEGYSSGSEDLFEGRTAYLSGASSPGDYLGVTVDDGTDVGTHTVEIEQIATAHKVMSSAQTDRTSALGLSGSFSIGLADGTQQSISVSSTSTLNDIASAINASSAASGVSANILKVSDSDYRLVLTATATGRDITIGSDGKGILQSLGVIGGDGAMANTLVEARDAVIIVDGLEITRASNTIDDVLDGVTLELYAAQPGTTLTLEVDEDLSGIKDGITALVDAYNAVRDFILTQQETTSNSTASSNAVLFADSLVRQLSTALSTALNQRDGTVSLSTFGITFDSDNTLLLDEDTLNAALSTDLDSVKSLFGFDFSSSSSELQLLRHPASLQIASFTMDIAVDGTGAVTAVSVGGDSSKFTVSGTRIIGATGTEFEGLTFVYTGSGGAVSVEMSSGIAEMLYQTAYAASNTSNGSLQTQIANLTSYNTTLESRASDIRTKAEEYGENLRSYYARLEASAQAAKLLLKQLQAASDSSDDD